MSAASVASTRVTGGALLRGDLWRGVNGHAPRLQFLGDEEGEFERLFGVQPRVAERLVAGIEVEIGEVVRAADAFGDFAPGHLDMHAARPCAFRRVDVEEAADFEIG